MARQMNIPNALSWYRLVSFPLVLYFILSGQEDLFTLFFCINLVTDIADGLIARWLKISTEFGARLDSIADFSNYINGLIGIWAFKLEVLGQHLPFFLTFVGMFVFSHLLFLLRFGRMPSFHLISWKIGGYLQGIWFFTLFVFGFWAPYFYVVVAYVVLACLEHIVLQFMFKEPRSNIKGLYWVLKEKNWRSTS